MAVDFSNKYPGRNRPTSNLTAAASTPKEEEVQSAVKMDSSSDENNSIAPANAFLFPPQLDYASLIGRSILASLNFPMSSPASAFAPYPTMRDSLFVPHPQLLPIMQNYLNASAHGVSAGSAPMQSQKVSVVRHIGDSSGFSVNHSQAAAQEDSWSVSKSYHGVQKHKHVKGAQNVGNYQNIVSAVAKSYCRKNDHDLLANQQTIRALAEVAGQVQENQNLIGQETLPSTSFDEKLNQSWSDEEVANDDQPLDLSLKMSDNPLTNGHHSLAYASSADSMGASPIEVEIPKAPVVDVANNEVIGYADCAKMPRSRKECRKGPGTARNLKSAKLWELLLWLLSRPGQYSAVIQWRNKSIGFFKLLNDDYLLDIYNDYKDSIPGRSHSNKKILYSSITRALRHYYWNSTLHPTPKRKTYQFGPNASGWQKGVEREHALQSLQQWEQLKALKSLTDPVLKSKLNKYGRENGDSSDDERDVKLPNSDYESLVSNDNRDNFFQPNFFTSQQQPSIGFNESASYFSTNVSPIHVPELAEDCVVKVEPCPSENRPLSIITDDFSESLMDYSSGNSFARLSPN